MILDERDKRFRRRSKRSRSPRRFLPQIWLTLKQIAVLSCGNEFLRVAQIIGVVSFAFSGQRDHGAMMKIVVPNCVEIVAAFIARANQFGFLPLILCDQNNIARLCGVASGPPDCSHDVFVGGVFHLLRGIEPEAVETKFVNPITPVSDEEFADRA